MLILTPETQAQIEETRQALIMAYYHMEASENSQAKSGVVLVKDL